MNAETSGRKPAVCLYCRNLRIALETQEEVASAAWCRLWQIVIPEPAAMGCTEFAPREKDGDEGVKG